MSVLTHPAQLQLASRHPNNPAAIMTIEIYCEWCDFGYTGRSPQAPGIGTVHHAGARSAAEEVARSVFGPNFTLAFKRRGFYIAAAKTAKAA